MQAKACAAASGQLFVELDHDDELTPDALELLRDAMIAHPDAGWHAHCMLTSHAL
jgi:hypothetical protein